ncbi:UNVERIFIED_CONTAM: hypothetical protein FKN15_047355 [Acipenser sinensis]
MRTVCLEQGQEERGLQEAWLPVSSPTMPAVELSSFRGSLILGFKRSQDVATMAKITELLHRDRRFSTEPAGSTEVVGYFLYNLMDSMSDSEVQAREETLTQCFHQLKKMDVIVLVEEKAKPAMQSTQSYSVGGQRSPQAPGQTTGVCGARDCKDPSVVLDVNKYLGLVKVLAKHGKIEDMLGILKEMKEKGVALRDANVTSFFHILNASAMRAEEEVVWSILDALFTLGLAKPSANLCSPLITVHLEKGDLPTVLEVSMDCQRKYSQMPHLHDVLCKLVRKGETELLQKVMDFVSQERGEMTVLYDLFFAFMHTGKYKEAHKIIECVRGKRLLRDRDIICILNLEIVEKREGMGWN